MNFKCRTAWETHYLNSNNTSNNKDLHGATPSLWQFKAPNNLTRHVTVFHLPIWLLLYLHQHSNCSVAQKDTGCFHIVPLLTPCMRFCGWWTVVALGRNSGKLARPWRQVVEVALVAETELWNCRQKRTLHRTPPSELLWFCFEACKNLAVGLILQFQALTLCVLRLEAGMSCGLSSSS